MALIGTELVQVTAVTGTGGPAATSEIVTAQDIANLGSPGTVHGYTAQQYFIENPLTDAATIAWNMNTQQAASLLMTAGVGATRVLGAPTNIKNGATYTLVITQSSAGNNALTYNAVFKFPGGVAPTLSTAANAFDVLTCVAHGGNLYANLLNAFA